MRTTTLLTLVALLAFVVPAQSTTYYVKPNGSDGAPGASWGNAWQTIDKVNSSISGGDTVFFAPGVYRGYLVPVSGTSGGRTSYVCGNGTDKTWMKNRAAKIYGSDSVGNWTLYSGNIWWANWPISGDCWDAGEPAKCAGIVGFNGRDTVLDPVSSVGSMWQGTATFDAGSQRLYVWLPNNGNPNSYHIEASCHPIMYYSGQDYTRFYGLDMKFGFRAGIYIDGIGNNYNTWEHCNIIGIARPYNGNASAIFAEDMTGIDFDTNYVTGSGNIVRACSLGISTDGGGGPHVICWYGIWHSMIESCYVWGAGNGIYLKSNCSYVTIRDNVVEQCWGSGIQTMVHCYFDSIYGNLVVGKPGGTLSKPESMINILNSVPGAYATLRSDTGDHIFILNNTLVFPDQGSSYGKAIETGYRGPTKQPFEIKYNVFYSRLPTDYSDGGGYFRLGWNDVSRLTADSNMYYIVDSNFCVSLDADRYCEEGDCNVTQWRNTYGKDLRSSFGVDPGFANPAVHSAAGYQRVGASGEMSRTYGGRTWTVFGAVQPPSGPDVTPPTISNVQAVGITASTATITWTTNEASTSQVDYGLTASYGSSTTLNSSLVISHSQGLSGLSAATTYHYRVRSRDAAGNEQVSSDYTFTTTAPDVTPPVISSVQASGITSSAVTITWTTDESSTSQVDYGLTASYGSSTTLDASLVISHSQGLSGLSPATLYHYRVRSRDAAGNERVSGDYTFTTTAPDVTPPTISNVQAVGITSSAATITWTTDEAATSQVDYGLTTSYGSSTTLNTSLVISHSQGLSGLSAATTYHYRVRSRDAAGNERVSSDFTVLTAETSSNLALGITPWVSGTYPGYAPDATTDGDSTTTWASNESVTSPHWLEVDLVTPQTIRRMVVRWARNVFQSLWMTSQRYHIQSWNGTSFVDVLVVDNPPEGSLTDLSFPAVTTSRIRIYQPADMGPATYTRILWVSEVEVYTAAGPDVIPPSAIGDLHE